MFRLGGPTMELRMDGGVVRCGVTGLVAVGMGALRVNFVM